MKLSPTEQRIEESARRFQSFPSSVRWVFADRELVLSSAFKRKPSAGPWMRRARLLLTIGRMSGTARSIAAMISFFLLIYAFVLQYRVKPSANTDGLLFFGMGALKERQLMEAVEKIKGTSFSYMDERSFFFAASRQRLGFGELCISWISSWRDVDRELLASGRLNQQELGHCLANVMKRIHRYAFFRAWFRKYLRSNSGACYFSAASNVVFAAAAAGAATAYVPHGFQARSLVFPDFSEVFCSNRFESEHFRSRLPQATIISVAPHFLPIQTNEIVAVAGDYLARSDMNAIDSFLEWAKNEGVQVVIRRHPKDRTSFWEKWCESPTLVMAKGSEDFSSFLEKYKPRLLVTWFSTTIFDALEKGVVPTTVMPESELAADVVFPFRDISLKWPEDKALIAQLLTDGALAQETAHRKFLVSVN